MYRTKQYHIGKKHKLFSYCKKLTVSSGKLYNRANYLCRQYATAVRDFESMKPLFQNQLEVYTLVCDTLFGSKYMPSGKWLSYGSLDALFKVTKDPAYYDLPAQANQQVLKLLLRDYKAFFQSLKAYKATPASFTGRPRMPGYVKAGQCKTAILTNQICRIKDSRFLKFPGTKTCLDLGPIPDACVLKEAHIKPANGAFVVDVVLEYENIGIDIRDDDEVIKELCDTNDVSGIRILGIDPGTENLAAVVNNFGEHPFLIKGTILKSVNQWYNKELARLKSCAKLCNNRLTTKQIRIITAKRNRIIKDLMHKASRMIADYAKEHHVDYVVMGHNVFQKQAINIGHTNNQNFVQIPFNVFAGMLRYKLAEYGIVFVLTEEAYTSKSDFLAMDDLPVFKEGEHHDFSGKRIKRGLYCHHDGTITNADLNGAANVIRKVFPKVAQWDRGIVDMPCSVWRLNPPAGSCRLSV